MTTCTHIHDVNRYEKVIVERFPVSDMLYGIPKTAHKTEQIHLQSTRADARQKGQSGEERSGHPPIKNACKCSPRRDKKKFYTKSWK